MEILRNARAGEGLKGGEATTHIMFEPERHQYRPEDAQT
jgi:hypothetical protein